MPPRLPPPNIIPGRRTKNITLPSPPHVNKRYVSESHLPLLVSPESPLTTHSPPHPLYHRLPFTRTVPLPPPHPPPLETHPLLSSPPLVQTSHNPKERDEGVIFIIILSIIAVLIAASVGVALWFYVFRSSSSSSSSPSPIIVHPSASSSSSSSSYLSSPSTPSIPIPSSSIPYIPLPSSSLPPPPSSSSSTGPSSCPIASVIGSNDVSFNDIITGNPFTWIVNTVSCYKVGNCVQITWRDDSNDYYIGKITIISPLTPSITVQFILVSPTNTGLTIQWTPWNFASITCPTYSSSSSYPSLSSLPPPSPSSMITAKYSALLNPIYYNLSLSSNQSPQWASFVISADGTTSIGCNSNCSFSYCNIYIQNQFVYSITSALNPGLSYNLGSFGLLSISETGQTIAIGSYGCSSNSMNGIYIFEKTPCGSGSIKWNPIIAKNTGGLYMIDTFIYLYQTSTFPLVFILSPLGDKLIYTNCRADNCKPIQIFTIVKGIDGLWDPSTISQSSFPPNYQGSQNFPALPIGGTLTNNSQTLFIITGDTAQNCNSQLTYSEYGVLWFNWNPSIVAWNYYLPFGDTGCGGGGDPFAQEGKAGLQYPFNGMYPATSISSNINGSYFVIGMPGVNNFTGSVADYEYTNYNYETNTYVPFYNTLTPFGPPFPLPFYSMFGKQVCISANGTLLYVSAPSSDSLVSTYSFDTVMSSANALAYYPANILANKGFPISYIFLYRRDLTNSTGWSYLSYSIIHDNSITISCSKLFNTTIYWNLNQNQNPIFNNFKSSSSIINTTYIPLIPLPWNSTYYQQPIINLAACPSNRTFYISQLYGNDLNDGQTPQTPWQTTNQVNYFLTVINSLLPGDQLVFCDGDQYYKTSLTITPNTGSYAYVNPFNCSLRFGSYQCNSNTTQLPQLIAPKYSYLPSSGYWKSIQWLSLNQTVNYTVYSYDLTSLQLNTGKQYLGASASSTSPVLPSQLISSVTINGNTYNIATHPNIIPITLPDGITVITRSTINETFYADNTCGTNACPAADGNSPIRFSARWSPGSYCRLIIQALFNGNQTLANQILPTAWYSVTVCGPNGFESPGCSGDPTSHLDIGTLNCTWFMQKYVYPSYPGLSMSSPLLDNFALTYSDWSITILPSITSSIVYGDFCNFVWFPGSYVYDYQNVLNFKEQYPGIYPDFRPIPGTSTIEITPNLTAFTTTYYGHGCSMYINMALLPANSITVRYFFDYECEYILDDTNGLLIVYPCNSYDEATILNGTSSIQINTISDTYTVLSTPSDPGIFPIEITELSLIGNIDISSSIISIHHCIINANGISFTGSPGYIYLVWESIFNFASITTGGVYQFIVNNTFISSGVSLYNQWKTILRGNSFTGGGATIISLQNIHYTSFSVYLTLIDCNNADINCILCSADEYYMNTANCDIFNELCLGDNLQYCPLVYNNNQYTYNINQPGPYLMRGEYNNYSYAGYGDVEYGTMQMLGGVQFINNYGYNPLPGGPISYSPCNSEVGGFDITYGNLAACIYINSNETVMGNILINCTDGGIYAGGSIYNLTNNLMIDSPPSYFQPASFVPGNSLYDNQRFYFINIRQNLNNPEGMYPFCPVPTNYQYGPQSYELAEIGNTGTNLYATAVFDLVNIVDLTPYQQTYSYAYSDTQVLVITNTTIQQLNDMWGPWGVYLGSGNQAVSIYDQLNTVNSNYIATLTGTYKTITPPIVEVSYGQLNVTQQLEQDLNATWNRINTERANTEYNESTSFILTSIPNTFIPL